MEYAEKILTAAYQLKDVISSVRGPMSTGQELAESEAELKAAGTLDEIADEKKQKLVQANVFYVRTRRHASLFEETYGLLPIAKAFFGDDVQNALFEFIRARHSILVYAQAYADDTGQDHEFTKKIHSIIWGVLENDEIAPKLDQSIQALEQKLLPIVRPSSANKK